MTTQSPSVNLTLLRLLADAQFHSGEWLAQQSGRTRSAIWKQIQTLNALPGIQIDAVTGRGYRLHEPLTLLDADKILSHLQDDNRHRLTQCHVLAATTSTNAIAADQPPDLLRGNAWFAEYQTAGRGRRGRQWLGGFAQNLPFSLAYQFDLPMAQLTGLSIAVSTVILQILHQQGAQCIGLKWPNDLITENGKLAGILVEVNGETTGPSTAIIGVGLNLKADSTITNSVDQPTTHLQALGGGTERNQIAGLLLDGLLQLCTDYPRHGLQPYLPIWRQYDQYRGKPVALIGPNQTLCGIQIGLADDGGIQLDIDGEIKTYYSGELSLRLAMS